MEYFQNSDKRKNPQDTTVSSMASTTVKKKVTYFDCDSSNEAGDDEKFELYPIEGQQKIQNFFKKGPKKSNPFRVAVPCGGKQEEKKQAPPSKFFSAFSPVPPGHMESSPFTNEKQQVPIPPQKTKNPSPDKGAIFTESGLTSAYFSQQEDSSKDPIISNPWMTHPPKTSNSLKPQQVEKEVKTADQFQFSTGPQNQNPWIQPSTRSQYFSRPAPNHPLKSQTSPFSNHQGFTFQAPNSARNTTVPNKPFAGQEQDPSFQFPFQSIQEKQDPCQVKNKTCFCSFDFSSSTPAFPSNGQSKVKPTPPQKKQMPQFNFVTNNQAQPQTAMGMIQEIPQANPQPGPEKMMPAAQLNIFQKAPQAVSNNPATRVCSQTEAQSRQIQQHAHQMWNQQREQYREQQKVSQLWKQSQLQSLQPQQPLQPPQPLQPQQSLQPQQPLQPQQSLQPQQPLQPQQSLQPQLQQQQQPDLRQPQPKPEQPRQQQQQIPVRNIKSDMQELQSMNSQTFDELVKKFRIYKLLQDQAQDLIDFECLGLYYTFSSLPDSFKSGKPIPVECKLLACKQTLARAQLDIQNDDGDSYSTIGENFDSFQRALEYGKGLSREQTPDPETDDKALEDELALLTQSLRDSVLLK